MRLMRFFCLSAALLLTAFAAAPAVYAESPAPPAYSTALIEAQTGMLLEGTDADTIRAAGTQTKLMTVYLAAEAIEAERLHLTDAVTVPPSAERIPGATVWLQAGETMTAEDLLKAVIIGNANDACTTLACRISGSEAEFVRDMNAAAFSLGMRSTQFADCSGLSDYNRTTAHDLALLCRALLLYDFLTPYFTTWRDTLRDGATELVSENRFLRSYDGILGLKAGHGDASGYTLALAAERNGLRCIAVVLGCPDDDERFSAAKSLLAEGFSGYYVTTPDFSSEFMQPLRVRHGTASAVLTETGELLSIAVPNGENISSIVVLPLYAEAPLKRGDIVGSAAFYSGDSLVYETPLRAAEDVPRRGFRQTLQMLLHALFR